MTGPDREPDRGSDREPDPEPGRPEQAAAEDAPVEDAPVPADAAEEGAAGEGARRRWPRRTRRGLLAASLIGVLTLLLGFALAVQVRSNDTDQQLSSAREEDLVRVLDDLTAREDRLRQQVAEQRAVLAQLTSTGGQSSTALEEARQRTQALGILDGTIAAHGPGLDLTITDPQQQVSAALLVNAVQELRGAGAETMQIGDVRVGVDTAVTGGPGRLQVDGQLVAAPYRIRVIGTPEDLAPALTIPGGVAERVRSRNGTLTVVQSQDVVVDALRSPQTPQYAEPTGGN